MDEATAKLSLKQHVLISRWRTDQQKYEEAAPFMGRITLDELNHLLLKQETESHLNMPGSFFAKQHLQVRHECNSVHYMKLRGVLGKSTKR